MKFGPATKIFFWGWLISFLGSLPLGTMNVTATSISVTQGTTAATLFAFGGLLTETVCLCIALAAMDWVRKQQKLFLVFEWLTVTIILFLAITSFIAAWQMKGFGNNAISSLTINNFLFGALLSALNPLHIPFWIGWTTMLINKKTLIPGKKVYLVYVAGISVGTIAGFDVFIYGGNYVIRLLNNKQHFVNWFIGGVLFITAIIQLYKIWRRQSKTVIAAA